MSAAARILIQGGTVITMDPAVSDLRAGDVLIENGAIAAVAPRLDVEDCELIDARGMIVLPGLIDAHRHLWYAPIRGLAMDATINEMVASMWPSLAAQYTPEDLYVATRAAAVHALENGVTTVFDWCHVMNSPEHGPEAVRALRELPLRAVFAYGASMDRKLEEYAGNTEHQDSWSPARRLRAEVLSGDGGRIRMALALQGPEFTTLDISRQDIATARELDLPMSMHCGMPQGAPSRRAIGTLAEAGLLGADMQFVHCCSCAAQELSQLADAGGVAVACPMAELGMGLGEPPIARMKAAGLPVAVGADAVCTASGDQFDEARTALFSERGRSLRAAVSLGRPLESPDEFGFTAYEALQAITIGAARACWLQDSVGSLTPGKRADVILVRARALGIAPASEVVGTLVSSAHGGDVDTVIVDGELVKRDGQMRVASTAALATELERCRDRLFAARGYSGMTPPATITTTQEI